MGGGETVEGEDARTKRQLKLLWSATTENGLDAWGCLAGFIADLNIGCQCNAEDTDTAQYHWRRNTFPRYDTDSDNRGQNLVQKKVPLLQRSHV